MSNQINNSSFAATATRNETIKLSIVQPSSGELDDMLQRIREQVADAPPDSLTISVRMSVQDRWARGNGRNSVGGDAR